MSEYVLFLFLGLGLGCTYAAVGAGVVLTYQGTGVVNFAVAAVGTVPVYVYVTLTADDQFNLLPGVPAITISHPPKIVALLIALAVAAALGALIHVLVSHPLRRAPVLARVVASVGVLAIVTAYLGIKFGTQSVNLLDVLPGGTVKIAGAAVPVPRLWLILLTVAVGTALAVWIRRSRTGLAIQASAENERSAQLAGLSTQRLALTTWMLATVFTSLVLVCAGSVLSPMTPDATQLLVVPGLAAAIVGRFKSLPIALGAGLVLGVISSELTYISSAFSWWPSWAHQGITDAVPFIVVVIALYAVGRSIPTRGDEAAASLPPVIIPKNRPAVLIPLIAVGVILMLTLSGTSRFGLITSLASALVLLSIVLLTGMVGQVTLAQAALAGATGFTLMKIQTGIPFPLSTLVAVLAATVVGVIVGLPALRIRGAQLAVVTLAAALVLQDLVFTNVELLPVNPAIPHPHLGGLNLDIQKGDNIARVQFGFMTLIIVVVVGYIVANLMRGGYGRRMLGVRSNERAAASIGISVEGTKLSAFAVAAALAGLGGALLSYSYNSFSATTFSAFAGLTFLAAAYTGGISSISGALVAAFGVQAGLLYVLLQPHVSAIESYYDLIAGFALVLTVLLNPNGIAGKSHDDTQAFLARRRARRAGPPAVEKAAPPVRPTTGAARRSTHAPEGEVVLRAEGVGVSYGGLRALDDLSLDVRAGEIVGLIGPNGSGKTTFVDAITGFTPCQGTVRLGDLELQDESPHRRARAGLVRTWQSLELFTDLSVQENVRLSTEGSRPWLLLRDAILPNRDESSAADRALALLHLDTSATKRPSELSLGQQKLLGVARALAMTPRALVLDEPAAGLDNEESADFGNYLRTVADTGIACLLIDHDMGLVMGICDRIYVIEFGHLIATGTPEAIRSNPAVVQAYLGAPRDDSTSSVEIEASTAVASDPGGGA